MKRRCVAAGVAGLLACLVVLPGCGRAPVAGPVGVTRIAVEDREPMPDISGELLSGGSGAVADAAGRVVVVNNWASWCAPCRDEIPVLAAAYASRDPKQVEFIGINVMDEAAAARDFADQTGIKYDSIVDASGSMLATIPGVPAKALPSTVVVDRQGRIAARIIGPVHGDELASILHEVGHES